MDVFKTSLDLSLITRVNILSMALYSLISVAIRFDAFNLRKHLALALEYLSTSQCTPVVLNHRRNPSGLNVVGAHNSASLLRRSFITLSSLRFSRSDCSNLGLLLFLRPSSKGVPTTRGA